MTEQSASWGPNEFERELDDPLNVLTSRAAYYRREFRGLEGLLRQAKEDRMNTVDEPTTAGTRLSIVLLDTLDALDRCEKTLGVLLSAGHSPTRSAGTTLPPDDQLQRNALACRDRAVADRLERVARMAGPL